MSEASDVVHGRWMTDRCRAICTGSADHEPCAWKHRGTQGAVVAATSRHVKATGHIVWLERVQARNSWMAGPESVSGQEGDE